MRRPPVLVPRLNSRHRQTRSRRRHRAWKERVKIAFHGLVLWPFLEREVPTGTVEGVGYEGCALGLFGGRLPVVEY